MIHLLAVDPGGSTGLVWGWFNTDIVRNLKECVEISDWHSATVTGNEIEQADSILQIIRVLVKEDHRLKVVIEDYRQQPVLHVVEHESLMPIRVAWCLIGMMDRDFGPSCPQVIFQQPHQRVPEQRLKQHGAWIRGRVHERAAMGHALAYLDKRIA